MIYIKRFALTALLVAGTFFATVLIQKGKHIDFQNTLVFAGIIYMVVSLFFLFGGERTYDKVAQDKPGRQRSSIPWPLSILMAGIILFLSSFVV